MLVDNDDVFEQYLTTLVEDDETNKIEIPKVEVPELPKRFEEHYPANGMQNKGAKASYRDDKPEKTVHIIEYEGYWKAHIDEVNPKHNSLGHLVTDAPIEAGSAILFFALLTSRHYGTWPFDN